MPTATTTAAQPLDVRPTTLRLTAITPSLGAEVTAIDLNDSLDDGTVEIGRAHV